jgi:hypothetical protein
VLDFGWARADRLIVHAEASKKQLVDGYARDPATVHVIPHVAIGSMPDAVTRAPTSETCCSSVASGLTRVWRF